MTTALVRPGMFASLAFAVLAPGSIVLAQGTPAAPEQVQLAFGYQCGDKFLIRNDGAQQVTVEYGLAGADQRASLLLQGKESAELTSAAPNALELWANGRMVAAEQKGNRSCAADQAGSAGDEQAKPVVFVRPLTEADYVPYAQPSYYAPRVVVAEAFPQYAYRSPGVVVAPFFSGSSGRGFQSGGFGGDGRAGQANRVEQLGARRSVSSPTQAPPRRPVQQFSNGGRERQVLAAGGGRARPSKGDRGHSHRR